MTVNLHLQHDDVILITNAPVDTEIKTPGWLLLARIRAFLFKLIWDNPVMNVVRILM